MAAWAARVADGPGNTIFWYFPKIAEQFSEALPHVNVAELLPGDGVTVQATGETKVYPYCAEELEAQRAGEGIRRRRPDHHKPADHREDEHQQEGAPAAEAGPLDNQLGGKVGLLGPLRVLREGEAAALSAAHGDGRARGPRGGTRNRAGGRGA